MTSSIQTCPSLSQSHCWMTSYPMSSCMHAELVQACVMSHDLVNHRHVAITTHKICQLAQMKFNRAYRVL